MDQSTLFSEVVHPALLTEMDIGINAMIENHYFMSKIYGFIVSMYALAQITFPKDN